INIPAGDHRGPPPLPLEARVVPPLPTGNGHPPAPQGAPPAAQEAPPPPAEPGQRGPLLNHGGGELPQDADVFVPPPPQIGELLSAYTNMRQHDDPWAPAARVAWIVLGTAIGVLIPVILALLIRGMRHPVPLILLPLCLGGIGLAIAWWATGFKRLCTYVAREGVARYLCP